MDGAWNKGGSVFISKEAINELPLTRYEGKIVVVEEAGELKGALKGLYGERVLGFDTETRPSFRKGETHHPSLLQLASKEMVLLVRLSKVGLPEELKAILSSPAILKVGVSTDFDVRELQRLASFEPAGFLDLADVAAGLGIQNGGLRGLTANLLGFRISKGPRVSNWARETLKDAQIRYAATDAWVGRKLYMALTALEANEGWPMTGNER